MKTIKLPTILLTTTLFLGLTALSAEDTKQNSTMKTPKAKTEVLKKEMQIFGDARLAPKTYNNADWTRKSYNKEYKRGKIKTH